MNGNAGVAYEEYAVEDTYVKSQGRTGGHGAGQLPAQTIIQPI